MTSNDADAPNSRGHLQEASFLGLLNLMLRNRRMLVLLPVIGAIAALTLTIARGTAPYTAESTFKVETSVGDAGSVAALASTLGMRQFDNAGESLDFYLFLLQSQQVLAAVATSPLPAGSGSGEADRARLLDHFSLNAVSEEVRLEEAVEVLRARIDASPMTSAGLIQVTVRGESPEMAISTNHLILRELVRFNLERRQSQSRAERRFIEEQVANALSELRTAERGMEQFLEENRSWENSPPLSFELTRLRREVELRNNLYGSLALSYEQARIEEVRSTPTITIIEPPVTAKFTGPGTWARAVILGFALGAVIALMWTLGHEFLRRQAALHPEDMAEFSALQREAVGKFLPWRLWSSLRRSATSRRGA